MTTAPTLATLPTVDRTRPVIRTLRLRPRAFRTVRRRRVAPGTRIGVTLSEAATVTFTVERRVRRRWRSVRGSLARRLRVGATTVRFSGRLGGRRLPRGSYRLVAVPVDAARNRGAAKRASFTVR